MNTISNLMLATIMVTLGFAPRSEAAPGLWNSSPSNFDNSPSNFENSPSNFNNSPSNWENSPSNLNSDRIVRDPDGQAMGYAVPKPDGGVNYFSLDGERKAYTPPED